SRVPHPPKQAMTPTARTAPIRRLAISTSFPSIWKDGRIQDGQRQSRGVCHASEASREQKGGRQPERRAGGPQTANESGPTEAAVRPADGRSGVGQPSTR